MAEKITLKNMLANLPQKTDVDTVVGRDASGNPVYIKKSDLAQVVAELIRIPEAVNDFKSLDNIYHYVDYPVPYYTFSSATTNVPETFTVKFGFVEVFKYAGENTMQIAFLGDFSIYCRKYVSGLWADWCKI